VREKKKEFKRDEKDWHVEECSYGSIYWSMLLPFSLDDKAIDAHLDKGVLHVSVKRPADVTKAAKTMEIRSGAARNAP
jgi:HSP20 family protein